MTWRRTLFSLRIPSKPPAHVEQWNPELDLNHKVLWLSYGPGAEWWFQNQGDGEWACGFGWLTFGYQYMNFPEGTIVE